MVVREEGKEILVEEELGKGGIESVGRGVCGKAREEPMVLSGKGVGRQG